MKAFKAFDKDMKCRDYQFEVGKTYEEPEAKLCECGFHACENPLDTLNYYDLTESRFAEVDLDATDDTCEDDTKRVGKKIHIKAELSLKDLIKASVDFLFASNDAKEGETVAKESFSKLAASGDGSQLAASGENSVAMNAGINGSAKASKGSWITLAEWKIVGNRRVPVAVVTHQVDGDRIKADTWYQLKYGAFVEVNP